MMRHNQDFFHVACSNEFAFQVFEPFGQVELVQLPVDPLTGLCKGFGFIQASSDILTYSHAALLLDIYIYFH